MQNEQKLREVIRESIKVYALKKNNLSADLLEEQKIRKAIKKLLSEKASNAPAPNDTLEGVLRDLLGDIIPQIRLKYTKLQTSPEERQGFMDYFIPATKDLIDIARGTRKKEEPEQEQELDEEQALKLGTSDKFIDVSDGSKPSQPKKVKEETEENKKLNSFYERGQNVAAQALNAVKKRLQLAASSEIVPDEYQQFDETLEANFKDWFSIWNRNPTKEESGERSEVDPDFDARAGEEEKISTDDNVELAQSQDQEDGESQPADDSELFEDFGSYFQ